MKDYELNYIIGYLKDNLNHYYICIECLSDKLIVKYKWESINIEIEVDCKYNDYDVIQISRACKRLICNKVLSIINKER